MARQHTGRACGREPPCKAGRAHPLPAHRPSTTAEETLRISNPRRVDERTEAAPSGFGRRSHVDGGFMFRSTVVASFLLAALRISSASADCGTSSATGLPILRVHT